MDKATASTAHAQLPHKSELSPEDQGEFALPSAAEGFGTILIDPPWRFQNRTGKMAPEHHRLHRYKTMSFDEIAALPLQKMSAKRSHLYMWCPNALLPEALKIMQSWGFKYKTNLVWYKVRKDGGPDGRGVGFYFRNVTELLLFGVRGALRTLGPARSQVNVVSTRKREHSRKPEEFHRIVERCSPGPYLEMFARGKVAGWSQWGDELDTYEQTRRVHKGYEGGGTPSTQVIQFPLGSSGREESSQAESRAVSSK